LLHVLEVGAGAERAARAAQDHDFDVAPAPQDIEHCAQLADQVGLSAFFTSDG
jgi:hypothetical protein